MSKLAHSNDETMEQIERSARERDASINDEPPETETPTEAQPEYAVVEVFGHRRHVGRVQEVDKFGAKFLRIDIPEKGKFENGFTTHMYGGGSIFSITYCDLATVEKAYAPFEPVGRLSYREPDQDEGEIDLGDEDPF